MNITNLTGADVISAFGSGLSPITSSVVGNTVTGQNVIVGALVLLLLAGVFLVAGLGFDVTLFLLSIAVYELGVLGYLPAIATYAVLVVWAFIVFIAFYRLVLRR